MLHAIPPLDRHDIPLGLDRRPGYPRDTLGNEQRTDPLVERGERLSRSLEIEVGRDEEFVSLDDRFGEDGLEDVGRSDDVSVVDTRQVWVFRRRLSPLAPKVDKRLCFWSSFPFFMRL
jgi:hypothetical protein